MTAMFLIDTNILVYQYDSSESVKQSRALSVVDDLIFAKAAAISTQIMSEFHSISTKKIAEPLSATSAYERLQSFQQSFLVIDVSAFNVLEAARGVVTYQFNFWDALIWATARLNRIPIVLSEDFNSGASIEGVRFLNPLAEGFVLEEWLNQI